MADQKRKYVIRKIRKGKYIKDRSKSIKRKRKCFYDGNVICVLKKVWEILDKKKDRLIHWKNRSKIFKLTQKRRIAY